MEPMQVFKRDLNRDNYNLTYTGRSGKTNWAVDFAYGKIKEDNITLMTYYGSGHDSYAGKNILGGVDWLEHDRLAASILMNTEANDKHLFTYGLGYTQEKAEGSRLKNAPVTRAQYIDPWDYDKSLYVVDKTASKDDTPESYIHNYKFMRNGKGFYWDKNYEYYGSETLPPVTYDEISKNYMALIMGTAEPELKERYNAFTDILKKQNTLQGFYNEHFPVMMYFGVLAPFNAPQNKDIKYNGKYYGEEFDNRKN